MTRDLKIERVYPHPVEHVWRALTDPAALAVWLMPNDFQPSIGHAFTFRAKPAPGFDGVVHCVVTEVEPPRRLAFSWRGGPGRGKPPSVDTIVSFTLEAASSGTRLVLEQRGFDGLKALAISVMMRAGWLKMLSTRLALVLDTVAPDGQQQRTQAES
jgi:uncharacterized protein YndB with AHSA1/START domain